MDEVDIFVVAADEVDLVIAAVDKVDLVVLAMEKVKLVARCWIYPHIEGNPARTVRVHEPLARRTSVCPAAYARRHINARSWLLLSSASVLIIFASPP